MKAQVESPDADESLYIFAYGSLIWRPDFSHTEQRQGVVHGYERRFWQASHDHRGTPSHPGRVVTMVPIDGGRCEGMIYRLAKECRDDILVALDKREQDGYERSWVEVVDIRCETRFTALTWLASVGNPSWVGEESLEEVARLIASRHGPSGSNREYLFRLHKAFEHMGIEDPHISRLVREVERLD